MAIFNNAVTVDEANLDEISNNTRTRANKLAITGVGSGSATIAANPLGTNWIAGSGTPYTATSASNMPITAANILTGICVLKPSANVNLTFDTAAQIVGAVNLVSAGAVVGDIVSFTVINGSAANTLAPTAANGVTFDTNQANTTIAANTSRYFMFRLTNVTSGSEAVVAYW